VIGHWPQYFNTHAHTHTHTNNHFTAHLDFVRDYPGEPAPERQKQEGKTNLDLREQEIVAVASAGPYANLHFDPDTITLASWMPFLPPN